MELHKDHFVVYVIGFSIYRAPVMGLFIEKSTISELAPSPAAPGRKPVFVPELQRFISFLDFCCNDCRFALQGNS